MQKQFSKILTSFFLLVFIFQLAGLIFLLAVPESSQAADPVKFNPQIDIGTFKHQEGENAGTLVPNSTAMIGEYIREIYKYAIGIVGILAAVVLMFGGIKWLVAGGNAERIGDAKSWIGAALTGLVITLASYTILYTVNPDLVNFKITTIGEVDPGESVVGCCSYYQNDSEYKGNNCKNSTYSNCFKTLYVTDIKFDSEKECNQKECIAKIATDTGATGCCAFEYSGETRCRNNYTEEKCSTRNNSIWDEGIECWENSLCDYIYP